MHEDGLPRARPIDVSPSPFRQQSQSSEDCAAVSRPGDQRFAATVEFRGMMDVTPDLAKRDAAGLYRYLVDLGAVSDPLDAYDPADPVVADVDDAQLIPTPVPGALRRLVQTH